MPAAIPALGDAHFGGLRIRGGSATGRPWAGVSLSERRRTLRLGYRARIGESVTVGVDQTLQKDTSGDDTAHYAIMRVPTTFV